MKTIKINHEDLETIFLQVKGISFDGKLFIPSEDKTKTLGLLNEKITQGAKTRLLKILKLASVHLESWEASKIQSEKDKEKLIDEEFEFSFEPISISQSKIEELISIVNYDFSIDIIFENE
jgi:hypothetical protein